MVRDNCDVSRVERIMALQPDDSQRMKTGYTVIANDGNLRELQETVLKKLRELN